MYLKRGVVLASVLVAASAHAQLNVDGFNGDFRLDGAPYAGGPINWGTEASVHSASSSNPSGATFSSVDNPGQWIDKTMIKFSAAGSGTFNLPSDRNGNTTPGADGESRIFGTWNRGFHPNNHQFSMGVQSDDTGDASVTAEVFAAPQAEGEFDSSAWTYTLLDNGPWDQDPSAGNVVIDKTLTPTITLAYALPSATYERGVVTWADGSTSASIFRDRVYTGVWLAFFDASNNFRLPGWVDGSPEDNFFANESGIRQVNGWADNMTVDFSSLPVGTYRAEHWGITWRQEGREDDGLFGGGIGGIRLNQTENRITIVPEPATLLALGAGLAGLAASRRRRTRV